MELSIDTSTRHACVGLSLDGEAVAALEWRSERNHSVELVPSIRQLMERVGCEMDAIQAVFLAGGPGGFSALRVGMSTAKAMAAGLDVPIVAVNTLRIEAQPYLGLGRPVRALIGAGRDRVYVGSFDSAGAGAEPSYDVMDHETLVNGTTGVTIFCGEGVADVVAELLRERLGENALVADTPPPTRRASVLAWLGYGAWQAGQTDDPAALEPLYLRGSQAQVAQRAWGVA